MKIVNFLLLALYLASWIDSSASLYIENDNCVSKVHVPQSNEIIKIEGTCQKQSNCNYASHLKNINYCRKKFNLICCPPNLRNSEIYGLSANNKFSPNVTEDQIIKGEKAELGEFPHMVSIGRKYDEENYYSSYCGGVLISNQFVLTAAHCYNHTADLIYGKSSVRMNVVNLDDPDAKDFTIKEWIIHPNYTSKYNDIAVIKLNEVVNFTKNMRPACLWQSENDSHSVSLCGFGLTNGSDETSTSQILMKVLLTNIDSQDCKNAYKSFKKQLPKGLLSSHGCAGVPAGDKDACRGDSGGPVNYERPNNRKTSCTYVGGLNSFGSRFCAKPTRPGVFTKIFSYLDWIEEIVWPDENKTQA